jgi:hypothetical protein
VYEFGEFCHDDHDITDGDDWVALLYQEFGVIRMSSARYILWLMACRRGVHRSLSTSSTAVCNSH